MARLTNVYRTEEMRYVNIGRRQLPVSAGDDNLMMLMDLNSKGLSIDSCNIKGKELEEFTRKFNLLTNEELRQSLEIDSNTLISVLNQCVQCVGCRRRVERLFYQLTLSGHPTLDPLVLKSTCVLTITDEKMKTPLALGTLLYRHHDILNNLLESKLRNKTRCVLHSLDAFRSKPFSETWREVWTLMKHNCRDELAVIETKELQSVMENFLKKHKFCAGCRAKIEKAYKILVGETKTKEKGYVSALYANIKKCPHEKHIHVLTNKTDFLDALIKRAEPEVNGSYSKLRERHAKTLEIAQEEILTCVGTIMYERLRRAYVSLREEERACQLLAAVGVHALCRSFDMFVEEKQGISNLELLYQEISRAEKARQYKREQKKLKKKKKKIEKKSSHRNICLEIETNDEHELHVIEDDNEASEHDNYDDYENFDDADVSEINKNNNSRGNVSFDNSSLHNERLSNDSEIIERSQIKISEIMEETLCDDKHQQHDCCQIENNGDNTLVSYSNAKNHAAGQKPSLGQKKKKKQHAKMAKQKQKQTVTRNKANEMIAPNISTTDSLTIDHQEKSLKIMQSRKVNQIDGNMKIDVINTMNSTKCNECDSTSSNCPCDVKDSGYGSEPLSHRNSRTSSVICSPDDTPESSEISCQEGFCNHHQVEVEEEQVDAQTDHMIIGCHTTDNCLKLFMQQQQYNVNTLSLQQMLDNFDSDTEDKDNCYIPQEVVMEYQCQREKVQQQRLQLRATLRRKFALLCKQQKLRATTSKQ